MSKSALNSTLQRPVLDGAIYNVLFTSSSCKLVDLGEGDTEHTVNEMKDWILETQSQLNTAKVKQLFSKPTQQATITNIHSFLFNHFQYSADGSVQNLRSPNCAWQQRYKGIDCKTYSILASVLLLKCNLIHYIRRITQPNFNPTQYTHVYVVVPNDQVNGDLSKGYYTVDGTLSTMHEPAYLEKHDTLMSNLQHYGLKGSAPTNNNIQKIELFLQDLLRKGENQATVKNIYNIVNQQLLSGNVNFQFEQKGTVLYVAGIPTQLQTTGLNGWFDDIVETVGDVFDSGSGSGSGTSTSTGGTTADTGSGIDWSAIDWGSLANTAIGIGSEFLSNENSDGTPIVADASIPPFGSTEHARYLDHANTYFNRFTKDILPNQNTPENLGVNMTNGYWILVNIASYVVFNWHQADATSRANTQAFYREMINTVIPTYLAKITSIAAQKGYAIVTTPANSPSENAGNCCESPNWIVSNIKLDTLIITVKPKTGGTTNNNQLGADNEPKTAGFGILGWGLLLVAAGYGANELRKANDKKKTIPKNKTK